MKEERVPNIFVGPGDRLLFRKVLDQVFLCERDSGRRFSSFMHRSKAKQIIEAIETDCILRAFGGHADCEQVQIAVSTYHLEDADFEIVPMEIKFEHAVQHRHILGSLIAMGIERDNFGDILVFERKAIVFVKEKISNYILHCLLQIKNVSVTVEIADTEYLEIPLSMHADVNITVDDNILSNIVAGSFNLSKSAAKKLIESKKIGIDWEICTKPAATVNQGNTVTVRGYGRAYINEILPKNEDDKIVINIHRLS